MISTDHNWDHILGYNTHRKWPWFCYNCGHIPHKQVLGTSDSQTLISGNYYWQRLDTKNRMVSLTSPLYLINVLTSCLLLFLLSENHLHYLCHFVSVLLIAETYYLYYTVTIGFKLLQTGHRHDMIWCVMTMYGRGPGVTGLAEYTYLCQITYTHMFYDKRFYLAWLIDNNLL